MNLSNLLEKSDRQDDQLLIINGVSWQQYLDIDTVLEEIPGLRLGYGQGLLEIMTLSPYHEKVKSILARLLETYALVRNIDLHGYGSTTQRDQITQVGLEPDESYCVGELKTIPDLAIEVVVTSGGINKLLIYRSLGIKEVWFWQEEKLSAYLLQEGEYCLSDRSSLFPDLDLSILSRFIQPDRQPQAVQEFYQQLIS